MKKTYFTLIILLSFAVQGCITTMKTPSKPGDIWAPPKWEKTSREPDTYWSDVRARKVQGSGALELSQIIDASLANNPSTRLAIEQARAAQARVKEAESPWYPQVNVQSSVDREHKIAEWDVNEVNRMYSDSQVSLTFLLFDFGGRAARAKEALHNLVAANFSYNQTVLDVILQAQTSYYNYYSAMAQLDASEDDVSDAHTTYYAAYQKFQSGIVTKLDVLQAKSTYENAIYTREGKRRDLKTTKGDLAKAMGLPPDVDIKIAMPGSKAAPDVTKEDVSKVIDYGLAKRPDIASQRALLRAKEAALAAANSDLFPTIELGGAGDATYTDYYGIDKNQPLLDGYDYDYTGYISLSWDVFDGFNKYSKRNEAKAVFMAEQEKLLKAEIDASADVWGKFYTYRTALSQLVSSEALYESSKGSYSLAKEGYDAGLKSILDLLQSQSQLSSARSKLISSRVFVFTSLANLAHSVGIVSTVVEEKSSPRPGQ